MARRAASLARRCVGSRGSSHAVLGITGKPLARFACGVLVLTLLWLSGCGWQGQGSQSSITEFALPQPDSQPSSIVAGPDGAVWFTDRRYGVGRITPQGAVTQFPAPHQSVSGGIENIINGPDGALWFTEPGTTKIGRIKPK
jgi:hypothetical protein